MRIAGRETMLLATSEARVPDVSRDAVQRP